MLGLSMKKIENLYNTIVDINKMYDHKIKVNTKNKKKLENFENNYVSNMLFIKNILEQKKYIPGKYNIFLFIRNFLLKNVN